MGVTLKLGDEVMLDRNTKPYTYKSWLDGEIKEKYNVPPESGVYTLLKIDENNVTIGCNGYEDVILKKHLLLVKPNIDEKHGYSKDRVELRLSIFNNNKSKSLEEMKAIEEWILGK